MNRSRRERIVQLVSARYTNLVLFIVVLLASPALSAQPDEENDKSRDVMAAPLPWMNPDLAAEQRARLLVNAMTTDQKFQQLTGAVPEPVPEWPECFGARHVTGIGALGIPTLRISNGPVGVGQNDCISISHVPNIVMLGEDRVDLAAYTDVTSAKATALPSAMAVAASFDPGVMRDFADVIATEMKNLALHVFEAPGINLARLPVLGRNFEYFGEDPYLSGIMGTVQTRAIQDRGIIAMPKHFVANEQETNRTTIQESIDRQVLREIYLLPFEMVVKDAQAASIMCAYNYVNTVSSCENREMLTEVLREDWGFTGFVQSDFFATKSTAATLKSGMDLMMPIPQQWAPAALEAALKAAEIEVGEIDDALMRRYTQMFRLGIFDDPGRQSPIDYASGGAKARSIGTRGAVLLQNDNHVLPFPGTVRKIVVIGKTTQVYAQEAVAGGSLMLRDVAGNVTGPAPMGSGGGSSDVVPAYTVTPVDGIRNVLRELGNATAQVRLLTVMDDNSDLSKVIRAAKNADAVVVMAGSISEEGADRASFADKDGGIVTAIGDDLDWYTPCPSTIASTGSNCRVAGVPVVNRPANSNTVAMVRAIQAAVPDRTVLVLEDNAGVALDSALVGPGGPAILEVWFPGQETGHIIADLLFGVVNPSGKSPVTFPFKGQGFLDSITARQFPGVVGQDGKQVVEYVELLGIGYRWYDANEVMPAFPFGHGLSYTQFALSGHDLVVDGNGYAVRVTVSNTGNRSGAEVVQVYLALPATATTGDVTGLPIVQPPRRLVGFQKVELEPGASGEVTISIDPDASNHPLGVWNQNARRWDIPSGTYSVYAGSSSAMRDLVLAGTFTR